MRVLRYACDKFDMSVFVCVFVCVTLCFCVFLACIWRLVCGVCKQAYGHKRTWEESKYTDSGLWMKITESSNSGGSGIHSTSTDHIKKLSDIASLLSHFCRQNQCLLSVVDICRQPPLQCAPPLSSSYCVIVVIVRCLPSSSIVFVVRHPSSVVVVVVRLSLLSLL